MPARLNEHPRILKAVQFSSLATQYDRERSFRFAAVWLVSITVLLNFQKDFRLCERTFRWRFTLRQEGQVELFGRRLTDLARMLLCQASHDNVNSIFLQVEQCKFSALCCMNRLSNGVERLLVPKARNKGVVYCLIWGSRNRQARGGN